MSPGQLLLAAFLAACLVAPALSQTITPQTPAPAPMPVVKESGRPAVAPRPVAITSGSGRTEIVGSRSSFKALRGR
jgi:hypothetical protein